MSLEFTDLKKHLEYLEELEKNLVRFMNLRMQLSQKRYSAIKRLYDEKRSPELFSEIKEVLRFCIRNEKRLLVLVKKGFDNYEMTSKGFNEFLWKLFSSDDMKKSVKQKTGLRPKLILKRAKKLSDIMELYYKNLSVIETRLLYEENFLERKNPKKSGFFGFWSVDSELRRLWKKELALDRKACSKLNEVNRFKNFFLVMREIIKRNKGYFMVSAIPATFIGAFKLVEANPKLFGDLNLGHHAGNKGFMAIIMVLALFGLAESLRKSIIFQKEVMKNNVEILKEMKRHKNLL